MKRNERLEQWLDTATAGLSGESKHRIAEEIGEHYRSACDEGLEHDNALESLGDPNSARREFRKTHLTSFQESLVKDYRGLPPKWRLVIYSSLFVLGCGVALRLPETALQRTIGLAMVLLLSAAMISLCFLVPRLYRRGRERIAIFLGAVSDWALYVGLITGSSLVVGNLTPGKTAFFLAIFGVILILYVPLLRKLHRSGPRTPHAG